MTAPDPVRAPCPVCGQPVAVTVWNRLEAHRTMHERPDKPGTFTLRHCPGSGALPPAGDLLGAPLAVAPDSSADGPRQIPAFQLDLLTLDLFGGNPDA